MSTHANTHPYTDWQRVDIVERVMLALKRVGFTPIELACAQNALDREFGL